MNLIVFVAGIVIVSPVDGIRPLHSARAPVVNNHESEQLHRIGTRRGLEDGINDFARVGRYPPTGHRVIRPAATLAARRPQGRTALQPIAAGDGLIEYKGEVTSRRRAAARQRSAEVFNIMEPPLLAAFD